MEKDKKILSEHARLNVKEMIKSAKEKQLIKPHTEAFKINPVSKECHKGKASYFCS